MKDTNLSTDVAKDIETILTEKGKTRYEAYLRLAHSATADPKSDSLIKCNHPDLVKAYAIQAFGLYYSLSPRKKEIVAFVKDQADSTSPKARKAAKDFLKQID